MEHRKNELIKRMIEVAEKHDNLRNEAPEELTYSDVEGRSTKEEAELACLEKLIKIVYLQKKRHLYK